jgi:hypothetical protein
MGALFVPFGLVGLSDFSSRLTWDSMEATPIEDAPESGFIKIEGRITGPAGLARNENPANWSWRFDRGDEFHVNDGTGTIVVLTDTMYSWQEPYRTDKGGMSAYIVNDSVRLVGKVSEKYAWKEIQLVYIWPAEERVDIDAGALAGGLLLTVPFALGMALLAYHAVRRNLLHARATAGAWPARLPPELARLDRSIPWFRNRPAFAAGFAAPLIGLLLALWLLLAASALMLWRPGAKSDLDWLAAGFAGLDIVTLVPAMFLYLIPRPPDLVGVSAMGIHFWHEPEAERLLDRSFVRWKDIIAMETPELGEPCRIYLHDGELVKVDGIGYYFGNSLKAQWQEAMAGRSTVPPAWDATTFTDAGDDDARAGDSTSFDEMDEGDETPVVVDMDDDGETTSFDEIDEGAAMESMADIVGDDDTTSFAVVDSSPAAWKEETAFDEMEDGGDDGGFEEMTLDDEGAADVSAADADEFSELELADGGEFVKLGDVAEDPDGRPGPGKRKTGY